jgi:hypothetical protein
MDRNTLFGMSTGAVMFAFGIVWLLLGLFRGRPSPRWLRVSLVVVGVTLATSIAVLTMRAFKLPFDLVPPTPQQLALNREIARHFYLVLGFELGSIFLAVVVLNLIHYPDYILPGIALIVAVHFFPLAALFKAPVYYGTALGGCAIALVGFFMADAGLRQKVVGLSFGGLLWATAAWIVTVGLSATPKIGPNLRPM